VYFSERVGYYRLFLLFLTCSLLGLQARIQRQKLRLETLEQRLFDFGVLSLAKQVCKRLILVYYHWQNWYAGD
jgi:hypothetical protein